MKINVLFTPANVDELYFTRKTVVVIDVLRATTTILTALMNGAKEVVPVGSMEFAMKASASIFGGQTLLGGERNAKKIEGFNLGNSPLEYTKEAIAGKSVIFFTTNGSKAIVRTKFADNALLCSFNNLSSVARKLKELNQDFEVLCSGQNGFFCIDDSVCAGKLISETLKLDPSCELSDAAKASLTLSENYGSDLLISLKNSEHGKLLLQNGFEKDVEYCSQLNIFDEVPAYQSGSVKIIKLN